MKSKVEFLDWDSSFFGFSVFKLNYENRNNLESALLNAKEKKSLFYVFSENLIKDSIIKKNNGKLVDKKVVLIKEGLSLCKTFNHIIEEYKDTTPTNALYSLAKLSGIYSRFKLDSRLPNFTFEKMYNLWIEKSCKNSNTVVFICKDKENVIGFITLELGYKTPKIGLIAVNNTNAGMGIGRELIAKTENHLISLNINRVSVATQMDNIKALKFYQNLGFKINSISNIYHFIVKKNENPL